MISEIAPWITIVFFIAFLGTLASFYMANGRPKKVLGCIALWSIVQSILAYRGFYLDTESFPPRFAFVLVPTILCIGFGLLSRQRAWIYQYRDIRFSTFLHTVRFPVELVLLQLFLAGMVPELMTFEGRNFDIIMGLTAPIIVFLLVKDKISKMGLLIWNVIGFVFIMTILFYGVLSSDLPFQQFGFDQPNRAVLYFPFVLLPAVIVPIVIWTHLSDILKLWSDMKREKIT